MSATSSALPFRAFTDSKEVPLRKLNLRMAAEGRINKELAQRSLRKLSSEQGSHSTFLQRSSIRCFLRALAKAPTSFIGFAMAHLLHFRKSKNLLESTLT